MRMSETMPCPEASFFGIVIQIQQQAGGNLSEALGNLSRVLRDRKKMKAKVAGAVDGSQGLGGHHRRAALHRRLARLPVAAPTTSCRSSPRSTGH